MRRLFVVLLSLPLLATGIIFGQEDITLQNIWQDYTFSTRSVPGLNFGNDGRSYTRLENNRIVQYDLTTGESTGVLY